jgi:hypothetical protein
MNKLLKRHKRQVARAKERVKVSEPDLRTPEQIKAAREASRPFGMRSDDALYAKHGAHTEAAPPADTAPKADDKPE